MAEPKKGEGVIIGKNVQLGKDVVIWNYVVIGDNTKIGDRTRIGSFCDIGKYVTTGRNCNVQAHVTISNDCELGNNVFIGPNSSLLNDKFPYSKCLTPSIVKDNVIVGGCVTILPSVTVNENSVIAAGSVVTKDVPSGTVVKGVPAEAMMTRKEYESRKKRFIAMKKH
jgi:UDP-2-acetamido-3-amino-2,3-dideoxy-glucuronate N-acetyltransferase